MQRAHGSYFESFFPENFFPKFFLFEIRLYIVMSTVCSVTLALHAQAVWLQDLSHIRLLICWPVN